MNSFSINDFDLKIEGISGQLRLAVVEKSTNNTVRSFELQYQSTTEFTRLSLSGNQYIILSNQPRPAASESTLFPFSTVPTLESEVIEATSEVACIGTSDLREGSGVNDEVRRRYRLILRKAGLDFEQFLRVRFLSNSGVQIRVLDAIVSCKIPSDVDLNQPFNQPCAEMRCVV